MRCRQKIVRVDRRAIGYMKFIFEAYDGIANLTTIDPHAGLISINIPDGCERDVDVLLESLGRDMLIEACDERELT